MDNHELERQIFDDIMEGIYIYSGKCFFCRKPYKIISKKKLRGNRGLYCSGECFIDAKEEEKQRKKEVHHYEVWKDKDFYYIKVDGKFDEKRNFKGKSWVTQDYLDELNSRMAFLTGIQKKPMLKEKKVPDNAIKIIDKMSAFLYDEEHKFDAWKNLSEVKNGR